MFSWLTQSVQFHNLTAARSKDAESVDSTGKWKKLFGVAARAGDKNEDGDEQQRSPKSNLEYWKDRLRAENRSHEHSKVMGLEYWLELVDRKHRYGSNLIKYHKVWQGTDSKENFFYWLDEGEGKSEDLEECPRDKLEKDQLSYLTREERYEYLVDIGEDGLLRWAKNGELVTTSDPKDDNQTKAETQNHMTDDLHNARGILQGAGHSVPLPLAKLIEMNQDKASWIFVSHHTANLH